MKNNHFSVLEVSSVLLAVFVIIACQKMIKDPRPLQADAFNLINPTSTKLTVSEISTPAPLDPGHGKESINDENLGTYWGGQGDGQTITFKLDTGYLVDYIKIAFYTGGSTTRTSNFDVAVSPNGTTGWVTVLSNINSTPNVTALQTFDINDLRGRYIRITGHGNTVNNWNSYTEVEIYGSSSPVSTANKISILGGYATTNAAPDGTNVPAKALDGSITTYWGGQGDNKWIQLDMDANYKIDFVKIAFHIASNALRSSHFDIQVSTDSSTWKTVVSNSWSAPGNTALETFDFPDTLARFVRIVGHGNSVNDWNSITELEIWGAPAEIPGVISDWETGDMSQWQSLKANNALMQFSTVNAPTRQGTYAAKFTVRQYDTIASISGERSEVSHYSDTWNGYSQEQLNDEMYYGWSTLLPTDWTNPQGWGIFMQWHSRTGLNPPLAFNIYFDKIEVAFATGWTWKTGSTINYGHRQWETISTDLNKGLWQDFIVHVKFRPDSTGIFEVWHRVEGQSLFVKKISKINIPTMQLLNSSSLADNGAAVAFGTGFVTTHYIQHGLYRGSGGTNTNVIYHDNWCRGASYSAVRATFP